MNNLFLLLLILVLYGCMGSASSPLPSQFNSNLVMNASFELQDTLNGIVKPKFWKDSTIEVIQATGYEFGLSTVHYCCGKYSVFISSTAQDLYPVWIQNVLRVPSGRKVRLSTKIRTENLNGRGFEFGAMCRVEGQQQPYTLYTSRGNTSGIIGTRDWTQYSISFDVPPRTSRMEVWLAMQTQTTGKIYFDGVELLVL